MRSRRGNDTEAQAGHTSPEKRVLDDHVGEGLGQVTRVGPKEPKGSQVTGTEGEQEAVSDDAGEQARTQHTGVCSNLVKIPLA